MSTKYTHSIDNWTSFSGKFSGSASGTATGSGTAETQEDAQSSARKNATNKASSAANAASVPAKTGPNSVNASNVLTFGSIKGTRSGLVSFPTVTSTRPIFIDRAMYISTATCSWTASRSNAYLHQLQLTFQLPASLVTDIESAILSFEYTVEGDNIDTSCKVAGPASDYRLTSFWDVRSDKTSAKDYINFVLNKDALSAEINITEVIKACVNYKQNWFLLRYDMDYPDKSHTKIVSLKENSLSLKITLSKGPDPTYNYSISYKSNNDDEYGFPPAQIYTGTDEEYSFRITTLFPHRKGYKFLGWATQPGVSQPEPDYTPNAQVTLQKDSPNLILYPVWQPAYTLRMVVPVFESEDTKVLKTVPVRVYKYQPLNN